MKDLEKLISELENTIKKLKDEFDVLEKCGGKSERMMEMSVWKNGDEGWQLNSKSMAKNR